LIDVSYFEVFGIPIVEAFKAEIPVVTSDRTSMPEISGKGGLIVDPDNNDMISKAMLKLFESGSLRQQLVEEGKALSGKFNWDQSAERVMEALEKTAQA
jgi:glycosyltransferase involved in cell wall biosynthesis